MSTGNDHDIQLPVTIRPERAADVEAVAGLVAAAFGSPVEAKLVADIRASAEYVPELSLVAEGDVDQSRGIVGHVMISRCLLVAADVSRQIAVLSPLAVHPDVQRRGVGGALVVAALNRADEMGMGLVVLQGSPVYYPRFGFEPALDHGIQMALPDWAPPEASQVARLAAYDAECRGTVALSSAFDGLD